MPETWYVMEDGSLGDPHRVVFDEGGRLRDQGGRFVDYTLHGPRSRWISDEEVAALRAVEPEKGAEGGGEPEEGAEEVADTRAVEPEKPASGYKTRETKAR